MTDNSKLALSGLRVLDFTWVYAGPFATRQLADLGAEVIKIEPRVTGALERRFYRVTERNGVLQSSYAMSLNRGKKSVSVDVRNKKGLSIITGLIKTSDIIISNMAPGAMKSLGLGYDDVREINPKIIYCSISCFGQTGSYAGEPGFDIIAQAASSWCGQVDPPAVAPVAIGDANAGIHAVAAILAALYYREKTNKGQEIDMSMTDCLFHLNENTGPAYLSSGREIECTPGASHSGRWATAYSPYGLIKARDGLIAIAALSDLLWEKLVATMGKDYEWLLTDPRTKELVTRMTSESTSFVHETLEEWVSKFESVRDVESLLREAGVPAMRVKKFDEAADAPYIRERGMIVKIKQPFIGEVETYGSPFKMSETPGRATGHAPLIGENTVEVLSSLLGIGQEEIDKLLEENVLYMEDAVSRLDEEKERLFSM